MALLKIVLFSLCALIIGVVNAEESKKRCNRVVGSYTEVKPNEYPALVSIHRKSEKRTQYCVGAIVADKFIVTAARCGYTNLQEKKKAKPEEIWIVAGDYDLNKPDPDEQKINGKEFIFHEDWNESKHTDDLMLIKLEKAIKFKKGVIEAAELTNQKIEQGNVGLRAPGWGTSDQEKKKKSTTPRQASLSVTEKSKCGISDDSQFCTTGQDLLSNSNICNGDEGAPLYWSYSKKVIVGVASRPYDKQQCLKDAKAIFTLIDKDWVEDEIE